MQVGKLPVGCIHFHRAGGKRSTVERERREEREGAEEAFSSCPLHGSWHKRNVKKTQDMELNWISWCCPPVR